MIFSTGNDHKFKTLAHYFPGATQLVLDTIEPQANVEAVAIYKCNEAWSRTLSSVVAEDTSLDFGNKGLPGPYIKHFMDNLTKEELVKVAAAMGGDISATFRSAVAYKRIEDDSTLVIMSDLDGRIVAPRGKNDTEAFNTIFEVSGTGLTLAEMDTSTYHQYCPRHENMRKLHVIWFNK